MADSQPDVGYQSLWHLVHTGGLTVETRSKTAPDRPALQTLLQLDGDQVLNVDLSALAGLTHWERLRVAADHRMKLRAQIEALKMPGFAIIIWLRYLSWAGAGGLCGFSIHGILVSHLSIQSLEYAFGGFLVWAMQRGLPWLLRQKNRAFHKAFHIEQRAVSQAIYERLRLRKIAL